MTVSEKKYLKNTILLYWCAIGAKFVERKNGSIARFAPLNKCNSKKRVDLIQNIKETSENDKAFQNQDKQSNFFQNIQLRSSQ